MRLPAAELKKFAAHAKRDGRTMSEIVRTDIWWQIRLRDHLDKKAKTK